MQQATFIDCAHTTPDMFEHGVSLHHPFALFLADRARSEAFTQAGYSPVELWADGYALLVRSVDAQYLSPIFAGTDLAIVTEMSLRSVRSLRVVQRIFRSSDLDTATAAVSSSSDSVELCRLEIVLVCANVRQHRVDLLPGRLLACLGLEPEGSQGASCDA